MLLAGTPGPPAYPTAARPELPASGEFTYFESEFFTQTYSQSGDPGQGEWDCESWVRRLQAGEMVY